LEQVRIFLYCCPSREEQDVNSDTAVLVLELSELPAIAQATKSDHTWNLAVEKVRCLVSAASKLKCTIERSEIAPASLYGLTTWSDVPMSQAQYELLVNGYHQVEQFASDIGTLKTVFEWCGEVGCEKGGPRVAGSGQSESGASPMMSSLAWLQQHMLEESAEFSVFASSLQADASVAESGTVPGVERKATVTEFREDTERLLKSILLAVQDVYKHCNGKSDECMKQNEDAENNDDEGNQIENGLVEALESLSASLSLFRVVEINCGLRRLMQRLVTILDAEGVREGNVCKRLVSFT
jgi:hypothetical protein